MIRALTALGRFDLWLAATFGTRQTAAAEVAPPQSSSR